jgi:hypothetical protein
MFKLKVATAALAALLVASLIGGLLVSRSQGARADRAEAALSSTQADLHVSNVSLIETRNAADAAASQAEVTLNNTQSNLDAAESAGQACYDVLVAVAYGRNYSGIRGDVNRCVTYYKNAEYDPSPS